MGPAAMAAEALCDRLLSGVGGTGIVETTRGDAFGAGISTGCSSRDTSFSPVAAGAAPGWPVTFAWLSARLGMILFGPSLGLMIGGMVGSIELPIMER